MSAIDHPQIAEILLGVPRAGARSALEATPAPVDFAARGGEDPIDAYLAAHAAVLRREADVVEAAPWLRDALLAADAAYQRARLDLTALSRPVPALRSLSGPHRVPACVKALRAVLALLAAETDAAVAARHAGPLAPVRGWIDRAVTVELEAALARAVAVRARALGPALEEAGLPFEAFFGGGGAEGRPAWAKAVVVVQASGVGPGSGVLIAPDRVLTAGHVLVPQGPDAPAPGEVRVAMVGPARKLTVSRVRIHRRWLLDHDLAFDYALLDVSGAPDTGLPVEHDFGVGGGDFLVQRYGHPADGGPPQGEGTIGFVTDMYASPDLSVPHGASGGAIVHGTGLDPSLVGITTFWSPPAPGERSPMGLPVWSALGDDLVERLAG